MYKWESRLGLPEGMMSIEAPQPDRVFRCKVEDGHLYAATVGSGGHGSPFQLLIFFEPPEPPEGEDPEESRFSRVEENMSAADHCFPAGVLFSSAEQIASMDPKDRPLLFGPCVSAFAQVATATGSPAAQRALLVHPNTGGPHGIPQ